MAEEKAMVIGLGDWGSRVAREYLMLADEGVLSKLYLAEKIHDKMERFIGGNRELVQKLLKEGKLELEEKDVAEIPAESLKGIDVAHVCVNNAEHYRIAKHLLSNNVNVLVEKPVSEKIEEVEELAELARQRKLVIKTGLIFRFDNSIKKIRELYQAGAFGKVYLIKFTWEFFREPMEGVDIVWDLMPHLIDMYYFITGGSAEYVTGMKSRFRRKDKAELAHIVMKNGAEGIFNISWFATSKNRIIEIFGEKKLLRADILAQSITMYDSKDMARSEQVAVVRNNTIRDEALNLIEDSKVGVNKINDVDTGLDELKVIHKMNRELIDLD